MNISPLCEPGLKRSAKSAFKRLDPELQEIVIDNLHSISFGSKDEFFDHNGKFKVVIHDVEWWLLPNEARTGKMALSFNEILLAMFPPSDEKYWALSSEYWRETLPEIKFLMLCIRYLTFTNVSVGWVQHLTMSEVTDEINFSITS